MRCVDGIVAVLELVQLQHQGRQTRVAGVGRAQVGTHQVNLVPVPDEGEQRDHHDRRHGQRDGDLEVGLDVARSVDLRRLDQGLGRLPVEVVEDQDAQAALEALAEDGRDDEGLDRAVDDLHIRTEMVLEEQRNVAVEEQEVRHGNGLRRQQEGQDQQRHPQQLAREVIPREAVAHPGGDEHLAQGRGQGDDKVLPQGVPVVHRVDGLLVIAQRQGGRDPLGRGVQQVLGGHQRPGEHVQHRVQVDEGDGDQQRVHHAAHDHAALLVAAQQDLLVVVLARFLGDASDFHFLLPSLAQRDELLLVLDLLVALLPEEEEDDHQDHRDDQRVDPAHGHAVLIALGGGVGHGVDQLDDLICAAGGRIYPCGKMRPGYHRGKINFIRNTKE